MGRLHLLVGLLFSAVPVAAQTCPAVNFRTASSQTMLLPGSISGIARQANGSFTLYPYSYSLGTQPWSVQEGTPVAGYQQNFIACSGHTPGSLVPPTNWSLLGDPLLGTTSRDPAAANLLNNSSTPAGVCLQYCNSGGGQMQFGIGTLAGSLASQTPYTVSQNAYGVSIADLNNDGRPDVIVLNSDTPATLSVYLTQANGTLGTPTTVPVSSGGSLSATAMDFNHDGNIDLAVTTDNTSSITILLGNGDGTFRSPITVNTGSFPEFIASADLNGDGAPDLVVSTSAGIAVHFGNGDGTFQGPQIISTPSNVYGIAVADLNHDGKPDIVASLANQSVVLVLLNAGGGTFPNVASYVTGYFGENVQFFIMDFDWDGNPDIVFAEGHPDALTIQPYSHAILVLFGNGDGTFNGTPAYSAGTGQPGGLAIGDFNGDGVPDAVVGSGEPFSTLGEITLLTGNGKGAFTPQPVTTEQGSTSLAAGQFTTSGHTDFVATNPAGISVFLGNGNGTFQSPSLISTVSTGITGAAVGDFNGDNKLDFAVVDSQGGTNSNAYVYLGNGDGTFQNPKTIAVGSGPEYAQAIDVNGDGKLDLVVTNGGTSGSAGDPGNVMVLLGNGDGTFQAPVPYSAGANPVFTLVTDVNGDGKPDLVTSTTANDAPGVSVRLNQGNGAFGAAQIDTTDFGPRELGAASFNGNGKVDLLVAHCCGDVSMGYLVGNGDGTFQPEAYLVSGQGQQNLRVADLNGDGKPDAIFTMPSTFAAAMVNISGTVTATTPITIQTSPAGLQFSVDGTAYTTAQTLNLSQGTHTIAVTSPQAGAAGTQYVFASWSDGGAASHSITVGSSPATYTATFQTQYQLSISASPAGGGTVTPASGGFYNAGTAVNISATPNSGYVFSGWTGPASSASSASTTVTMSAPETVIAGFSGSSGSCSLTLGAPGASLPPTGTSTIETCPNNSGQPSCGVLPETARSFTVSASAGCGAWTATSSNPEFLQITAGATGTGAGSVSYTRLTNTHNAAQNDSITVASGAASATYSITETGNADSEVYRQIYVLYEQLLGRDPDAGGFAFWSGGGGAQLGTMADDFLTSPEAFNSDFAVMAAY
ncbi:MAG TPA: FG-GAP-like repeat-containing protein, partial [Bryobacteraceae bacterium]|nr:FG-GAP-like repeat-containing protein [Bryobacteraceae bacterium]